MNVHWPPVHSADDRTANVSEQDFQVTYDLVDCTNKIIGQSSTDFTSFDAGSVKIPLYRLQIQARRPFSTFSVMERTRFGICGGRTLAGRESAVS